MLNKTDLLEYLNIFGVNLRRHRNNRKMSYDSVAKQTGVSKSILSRIENGQTAPSFETFLRLYDSFGINTDFFRTHPNNDTPDDAVNSKNLEGGFKFRRMNFTGRVAVLAEVEEIYKGTLLHLQARRSFEEHILLISGNIQILYQNKESIEYSFGEMFTLPFNRQGYDINSESGAKIIRISVPLSRDQSALNRYLTILGGTSRGIGGKGTEKI